MNANAAIAIIVVALFAWMSFIKYQESQTSIQLKIQADKTLAECYKAAQVNPKLNCK